MTMKRVMFSIAGLGIAALGVSLWQKTPEPIHVDIEDVRKISHVHRSSHDVSAGHRFHIHEKPQGEGAEVLSNEPLIGEEHGQTNLLDESVSEVPKHQLVFEDGYGGLPSTTSKIDKGMVAHGLAFHADMAAMSLLSVGEKITVSLPHVADGIEEAGQVTTNELTPITSSRNFTVAFSEPGTYMTAFYTEGLVQGNIYSAKGTYVYEHDGEHGYIMPVYEYKRMKNALLID